MSNNLTNYYLKYGDRGNFTVYDGHEELYENDDEDYYENDPYYDDCDGIRDGVYYVGENKENEPLIQRWIKRKEEEMKKREKSAKLGEELDRKITDEEYEQFLISQDREKHRYHLYQLILDEFESYVPDMLEARQIFQEHLGISMAGKLISLDQKRDQIFKDLFYNSINL
jgi:hypothetical protein